MAIHGVAVPTEPERTGTAPPRVAVVLINSRAVEEEDTVSCVASLRASELAPAEIVVVDNGSPPEVGDRLVARLDGVTVIRTGENLGFTGGNNLGIEHALAQGCGYVWVLNNDTIVEPDCLGRLVAAATAAPDVGAVGAKILYFDHPDHIWFGGGEFSTARALGLHRDEGRRDATPGGGPVEEVTFLTGCCMLLSARALREVGAFETDFFIYVEDVELSVRLRQAGYRLLYVPSARMYHRITMPEPPIPPHKIVLRDRNRRRLVRRRFGLGDRLRFALFFYPTRLVHGARYLARADWARFAAICRGLVAR